MKEITLGELKSLCVGSMMVKDESVRGVHTVPIDSVVVGDVVVLDNHFTTVIADDLEKELHDLYHDELFQEYLDSGDLRGMVAFASGYLENVSPAVSTFLRGMLDASF